MPLVPTKDEMVSYEVCVFPEELKILVQDLGVLGATIIQIIYNNSLVSHRCILGSFCKTAVNVFSKHDKIRNTILKLYTKTTERSLFFLSPSNCTAPKAN